MKQKSIIFLFLIFILQYSILNSQDTWIIDLLYQDLYPDDFYYPDSYNLNVIPAIGGGYLATAFVNPGNDYIYWREMLFWKVNSQGDVEWRLQNTNDFEDTYFSTMVSNGVDRYYAMSAHNHWTNGRSTLFVLDENCNIISSHNYYNEDGLKLRIRSMKLLDDGLIMVGQLYEEAVYSAYVILRTDLEGNIIWIKDDRDFGIIVGYPWEFNSVITTSDNGFLACGFQSSNPGTGYVMKFNAEGDTLWTNVNDNTMHHSLLEYSNSVIYSLFYRSDEYPGHTYLMELDSEGNFIDEWLLLSQIISQGRTSHIVSDMESNLIILYNSLEGEIHKVTPEGEVLWSYDYFTNANDLIGSGADNLLIDDEGYYLYNGTLDGWTNYPDFKLVRTDPDGIVPVEDPTIFPISEITLTNYPNPFNPKTIISFDLPGDIKNPIIEIFNIKGEKIRAFDVTLSSESSLGKGSTIWNAENCASGIYLYRLISDDFVSKTNKMLLLK